MKHLCVFLLFSYLGSSLQKSTPQDDHYIAAVVEFIVDMNVQNNLRNYVNLIQEAAQQDVDIIVFPESTLTVSSSFIEVPMYGAVQQYPIPALNPEYYDQYLVAISTAAREHGIYVVINSRELVDCTVEDTGEYCPEQRRYFFNTNVVFDRTGAVIDRYRKINLFGEPGNTPSLRPDLGVFTTDFGVTFGHFICFDLKFQVPAIQIIQKANVRDIIFPTMWFSELPYLTAIQIQEAYAYALDVNFLGAGGNNIRAGSAGSGIYSGKAGALISIMPGVPTTRLLVAKVPKVPGQVTEPVPGPIYDNPADHDNLRMLIDPSLPAHVTRPLVEGTQEFTLVDRDVTCSFRITLRRREGSTYYRYRAGAFSGVRTYSGFATGGTRICSVYACTGDDKATCGYKFPTYTENTTAIFEELSIVGTMLTPVRSAEFEADDSAIYAVSSTVYLMPLEVPEYTYTSTPNGDVTTYRLTLNNHTAELYGFAIWGRQFTIDGQIQDPPLVEDDVIPETTTETPQLSTFTPQSTSSDTQDPTETPEAATETPQSSIMPESSTPGSPEASTPDSAVAHILSPVLLASVITLVYNRF